MFKEKVVIAFLALTFGMVLTIAGTQAFLKDSKSVSNSLSTGTLEVNLDKESDGTTGTNYFINLTNIKPGDSGSEIIKVTNSGTLKARVDFNPTFSGLLLNGGDQSGSKGLSFLYKKSVDNGVTWTPFIPGDTNWLMDTNAEIWVKVIYDFPKDYDVPDQSFYQGKEVDLNITVNAEQVKNNPKPSDAQPEQTFIHALSFDGTNDEIEVQSDALKQYPLTLSAWVKPELRSDGTSFPNNVISNDRPGHHGNGFGVNVWNSGSEMNIEYENGFIFIDQNTFSFAADTWYHVAVVYDVVGTELLIKAYVDGNLIYTSDASDIQVPSILDASDFIAIGKHNDDANYSTKRYFKGAIRDVRVWNIAQSVTEVQVDMEAISTGSEPGLVHYWRLDDAGGRLINDIGSLGIQGSFVTDPVWYVE
ncbi:hypothetical protein CIB95_12275 [Lottiidibacillus patelloidae]|uniref:LamG-like jellyroll fold domain-containing protein n=1 Tax=Lottiidibacillus patelloidae TaxID=2670334 RepID=A0A263BS42_9BACI|nr:TasA family protein [Lottiidibacillus patelloidae]OZM56541.1 hypothetical protein CIB95_12275 [Lottiidibacillus patelloidae]